MRMLGGRAAFVLAALSSIDAGRGVALIEDRAPVVPRLPPPLPDAPLFPERVRADYKARERARLSSSPAYQKAEEKRRRKAARWAKERR